MQHTEIAQATQYDSRGQKTGQKVSYFSWWAALDEERKGLATDYFRVMTQAAETGKLKLYGAVANSGREVDGIYEARRETDNTVRVLLEDGTEVPLYPNFQFPNQADTICSFWITDQNAQKDLLFSEIEFDENGKFTVTGDNLIELHGQYLDGRENNEATVTKIVCLNDKIGSCLAAGAGQRYLLGCPATDRAIIKAYRVKKPL